MSSENVLQQLAPIMCETFDEDGIVPTREMTAQDVAMWDSVNHIRLILAIEEHFSISFTPGELEGLENVGALVDAIARKL